MTSEGMGCSVWFLLFDGSLEVVRTPLTLLEVGQVGTNHGNQKRRRQRKVMKEQLNGARERQIVRNDFRRRLD